jgi:UDP-GlcNAc:undecaprenyl-phosphate GlcNAc-1-phosphate transferase
LRTARGLLIFMGRIAASESSDVLRYYSADQVLSNYVYVFYAAYLVAFLLTPLLRAIAIYYGIIDEPDGLRKMHRLPVAFLGGVAVFIGWLAGLAISQFLPLHRLDAGMPQAVVINFRIIIGACMIVMLGLWDDVLHMSPWKKIVGQVFAGICLLSAGIGTNASWIFIEPVLRRMYIYIGWPSPAASFVPALVSVSSVLLVIFLVVLCCNASNLMDGLDGLCGGVTAVIAAGFLFLAVHLAMVSGAVDPNTDALRVVLGLALLGGVLAFIPYNFNPASIFMGDTGSQFLGFCCATLMILFASEGHAKWFLGAMVILSLPLLDTVLTFVRRWVNGRPLFSPDRLHFHHQLVARGFSVKQTVLISYGLSVIFGLLGAGIVYMRTRYAFGVYLVVLGSIIVAAVKMGMVHDEGRGGANEGVGAGFVGMRGNRGTRIASEQSHEARSSRP